MRNVVKRILASLLLLVFFVSATLPMVSVGQLSTSPGIEVTAVWLDGAKTGNDEYANETHMVMVTVKNSGNEYLKDIVVSCEIFSDVSLMSSVHAFPDNTTVTELDIGEEVTFMFESWEPMVADPNIANNFWINTSAIGMGFMDISADDNHVEPITIQNITAVQVTAIKMDPAPYMEDLSPPVPGEYKKTHANATHTVYYKLTNYGNVKQTGVSVDATGYNLTAGPLVEVYTSTDTVASVPADSETDWIAFPDTWDLNGLQHLPVPFETLLNVTAEGTNMSYHFWIFDYTDVTPMDLTTDLAEALKTTTFNTVDAHTVQAVVLNNGNQLIDVDFDAELTIAEVTGPSSFGPTISLGKQTVTAGTTPLDPGETAPVAWAGVTPPGAGDYQFNVTTLFDNMVDYNLTNNMTSVAITFDDTSEASIMIDTPMEGKYPRENLVINATIYNDGTQDFSVEGGAMVDLAVYDTNDTVDTADDVAVWMPVEKTIEALGPSATTWAEYTWTGVTGGEFRITVNVTLVNDTNAADDEDEVIVKFPYADGVISGTITPAMAGIVVEAWDGATLVQTTSTDASGDYDMNVEAILTAYNVTVTPPYGYYGAYNDSVMVLDDLRVTDVDFDLMAMATGTINGTITLVEYSMSDPLLDYTDIKVMVDGTPLWVNTDDIGNYTILGVVPGTVNVTASKDNYMTAWNDSVDVVADTNVTVTLTLHEDWDVMVTPKHEALDVATDTSIMVEFEEAINTSSVNSTSFKLMDGATVIGDVDNATQLVWATGNMSFEFTPAGGLEGGKEYTVWLSMGVNNTTNVQVLHRDWTSTFTTEQAFGKIQGIVTDNNIGEPLEGVTVSAGGVQTTTAADGSYELEVVADTYTVTATMALYEDGEVTGIVVNPGETTIDVNISMNPIINVDVKVMKDDAEVSIDADGELTDVSTTTYVKIIFEEAIDNETLDIIIKDSSGLDVGGTMEYNATSLTMTFTPDAELDANETYTITMMDTVVNATNVSILPRDVTWTFTTVSVLPTVTVDFKPGDGATNRPLDVEVELTFSHEMNPTETEKAITATFTVTNYTWAADGKSVVLEHDDLEENESYTVEISDAGLSVEGYKTEAGSATFTTGIFEEPEYLIMIMVYEKDKPISGAKAKFTMGDKPFEATSDNGVITFKVKESEWIPGTYSVKITHDDYEDKTIKITLNDTPGDYDPIDPVKMEEKKEEGGLDPMAIAAIIIVVIIIIILLALAMKPKKPAEEEIAEEEEEEGEEEEFECPECGAVVSSGETVCPECGAEFEEEEFECPECGASVEAGVGTCPECGAEFEEEEEELEGEEEEEEEFEVEDEEGGEEEEELEGEEEEEELEEEDLEEEDLEEEELEEEEEELEEEEEELEEEEEELEEEEEEGLEEEETEEEEKEKD
jgi:hypothetical protein